MCTVNHILFNFIRKIILNILLYTLRLNIAAVTLTPTNQFVNVAYWQKGRRDMWGYVRCGSVLFLISNVIGIQVNRRMRKTTHQDIFV